MEKQNQQLAEISTYAQRSIKLISSLVKLEVPAEKAAAKMDIMRMTADLFPGGKPNFPEIRKYKTIAELVEEHGENKILKAIVMLVRDFAAGINVVRNLNEDQAIEVAFMLVHECGNFRLEDYAMMFDMAKKGQIGNIFDHLDIQVISKMLDEYWFIRQKAGRLEQEKEYSAMEGLGPSMRQIDDQHPQDAKLNSGMDGIAGAMGILKNAYGEWLRPEEYKGNQPSNEDQQ